MKRFWMTISVAAASVIAGQTQPNSALREFRSGERVSLAANRCLGFWPNYGTFSVSTNTPYDFSDTFNFTNTGTMLGIPGFQFDTASSSQPRRMAASFYNRRRQRDRF